MVSIIKNMSFIHFGRKSRIQKCKTECNPFSPNENASYALPPQVRMHSGKCASSDQSPFNAAMFE